MAKTRVQSGNLKDAVAEKLALRILSGTYPSGSTLPIEADLLDDFGVSRTCLREALQVLSGKGLITSRPKRGTTVRPAVDWNYLDATMLAWRQKVVPRRQLLGELIGIRALAEPEAAALAAGQATPEEIEAIGVALEVMFASRGERTKEAQEADVRFHRLLLAASHNALLSGLGACIEEALRASIAITSAPGIEDPIGLDQHRTVFDAVKARDAKAAREASALLIEMTRKMLEKAGALD